MIEGSAHSVASQSWWSAAYADGRNGPVDGRVARSERTKRKIVDAASRLIDGDSERFTTGMIARRAAGFSRRGRLMMRQ